MGAADRARAQLVDRLREAGVLRGPEIEEAFRAVPRHRFLPRVPLARAYADEAVAVQAVDGVTTSSASQPSMVAIMLGQLDLRPGHRVLEIGAGTGWNAALMARIVGPSGRVVAVDIDAELVDAAARHLAAAGVGGVTLVHGDGALGHPDAAPYDRVVLTVGTGDVRPEWTAQLAPGGRLLLPLAVRGTQLSVALDLGPDGVLRSDSVQRCAFVRLRGLGAVPERGVGLGGGLSVFPAAADGPPPRGVAAALARPGASTPLPVPLGPSDVWDGFGLWLALAEPGAVRLVGPPGDPDDPDGPPVPRGIGTLPPVGAGRATVGVVDGAGLAVVVLDPRAGGAGPWRTWVQACGPGGDAAARRVLAAADEWAAAGRPAAADLRLTVVPRGTAVPAGRGVAVATEHRVVLVDVAAPR